MLAATGLECVRGGRRLFGGLQVSVGERELIRIAGANGSGKTSLLRILCGLLSPTGGEVRWEGSPIHVLREDYARRIVYLGHAPAVKDDLTAAENLSIGCALGGLPFSREAIGKALSDFGLSESRVPVRRLSQGQRRRAALARLALATELPIWFLDEPFVALDAAAARLVEQLIARQVARGSSVVYTTHQPAGIDAAVTRLIELA